MHLPTNMQNSWYLNAFVTPKNSWFIWKNRTIFSLGMFIEFLIVKTQELFADHYKVLGIPRDADMPQIKRAYRRLALKFHPDIYKSADAQSRFVEIPSGIEILSSADKRAVYNILFDGHSQVSERNYYQKMRDTELNAGYQKWRDKAYKNALDHSNEVFSTFKSHVFETIGEGVEDAKKIASIFLVPVFCSLPLWGLYSSYHGIKEWDINKYGNAIAGFVICSILSLAVVGFGITFIVRLIRDDL